MPRLTDAQKLFVGSLAVSRVYAGANLAWEATGTPPAPTPPSLRQAWSSVIGITSASTGSLTIPASSAVGDTVLIIMNRNAGVTPTSANVGGGFAAVLTSDGNVDMRVFRGVITTAGAGTISIPSGATTALSWAMYQGTVNLSLGATGNGPAGDTALTIPSVSAPDASIVIAAWTMVHTGSVTSFTLAEPAGWTEHRQGIYETAAAGTSGNRFPLTVASKTFTSAGSSGTGAATRSTVPADGTNQGWASVVFALTKA